MVWMNFPVWVSVLPRFLARPPTAGSPRWHDSPRGGLREAWGSGRTPWGSSGAMGSHPGQGGRDPLVLQGKVSVTVTSLLTAEPQAPKVALRR